MLVNEVTKKIGELFNMISNKTCSIHAMGSMMSPPMEPVEMAKVLYNMAAYGLLTSYVDSFGYVHFKKVPYEECKNKCLHFTIFNDHSPSRKKKKELPDLIIPLDAGLQAKLVFTKGGQNPPWINDNVWVKCEVQLPIDENNNIVYNIAFGDRLFLMDDPLTISWGCRYSGFRSKDIARNGKTYKEAYEKIKGEIIPQIEQLKKLISQRKSALENA